MSAVTFDEAYQRRLAEVRKRSLDYGIDLTPRPGTEGVVAKILTRRRSWIHRGGVTGAISAFAITVLFDGPVIGALSAVPGAASGVMIAGLVADLTFADLTRARDRLDRLIHPYIPRRVASPYKDLVKELTRLNRRGAATDTTMAASALRDDADALLCAYLDRDGAGQVTPDDTTTVSQALCDLAARAAALADLEKTLAAIARDTPLVLPVGWSNDAVGVAAVNLEATITDVAATVDRALKDTDSLAEPSTDPRSHA